MVKQLQHSVLQLEREVRERRQAEDAALLSEGKYRSLIESVGDSIYLVDRDYRYLYVNTKHLSRLGQASDDLVGRSFGDFHSPEETRKFIGGVDHVFSTGDSFQLEHFSLRDSRYFLRTLSPVKDADGSILAVTVVSKDINDLKEIEDRMRRLSITDELTGLYNRRGFFAMFDQLRKVAKRHKQRLYMLYADLDNLKEINDTLGHKSGDRALIDAADILKATYRESDIVARIGGDEFVVIPIGETGDNDSTITDRMKEALDRYNAAEGNRFMLSLSFGLACYDPEAPSSIDEIISLAEKNMYEQKRKKKGA